VSSAAINEAGIADQKRKSLEKCIADFKKIKKMQTKPTNQKETKFCEAYCKTELSIDKFYPKGGKKCIECTSRIKREKHQAKKKEREMWGAY
jgi:hypothetical protein